MLAILIRSLLVGLAAALAIDAIESWDRDATEREARAAAEKARRRRDEAAARARSVYDSYKGYMSSEVRDAYRRRFG